MKKVIEYMLHAMLLIAVGIFFVKISDSSHILMSGYLTSMTIAFVTEIALIYLLIRKIFKDLE